MEKLKPPKNGKFFYYLERIYNQSGYLDKYGDSVVISFFIIITFFALFGYFYIKANLGPIKADWEMERCQPYIIPFAGFINREAGQGKFEATQENFVFCANEILSGIVEAFMAPFIAAIKTSQQAFNTFSDSIQNMRNFSNYFRMSNGVMFESIFTRFMNFTIPLRYMIEKTKAILGKIQGSMASALYTFLGTYMAIKSFLGGFITICAIGLAILAGMILLAWIIPFTWPWAAAATTFFVALAVPLAIIVYYLQYIVTLTEEVPKKPSCFDKNTVIQTKNGPTTIDKLKVGTILERGEKVTSIMKLDAANKKMFFYNGVIVSGEHRVIDNGKFIYINKHPNANLLENYKEKYIYCFNTTSKRIFINNIEFLDYDDMTFEEDTFVCETKLSVSKNDKHYTNYELLDGGFDGYTKVEMEDGTFKNIKEIQVGEMVKNGGKVYGIVELKSNLVKQFYVNNELFCGGSNLVGYSYDLGVFSTLTIHNNYVQHSGKLFHILTEQGYFNANSTIFYDYNGCMDRFLEMPHKFNEKSKNFIF